MRELPLLQLCQTERQQASVASLSLLSTIATHILSHAVTNVHHVYLGSLTIVVFAI